MEIKNKKMANKEQNKKLTKFNQNANTKKGGCC